MFKLPKRCIRLVALMLPLPREAAIKGKKVRLVQTVAIPRTTEDHKLVREKEKEKGS